MHKQLIPGSMKIEPGGEASKEKVAKLYGTLRLFNEDSRGYESIIF